MADWLGQHPSVFVSALKEPHFFNTDDRNRLITKLGDYEELFATALSDHRALGEASVGYLHSRTAVSNIEAYCDRRAKYIVCLRNPVDMAYSLHSQLLFTGDENVSDFKQAWNLQGERRAGRTFHWMTSKQTYLAYRDVCALGTLTTRLLDKVDPERVHFVFLDDMARDPRGELNSALRFLDVPDDGTGIRFSVANPAKRARSKNLTRIIAVGRSLRRTLGLKKGFGVLSALTEFNRVETSNAPLDAAFGAMLSEAFSGEVEILEQVTGRDLSGWKT